MKQRYMTRGAEVTLPFWLRTVLWMLWDSVPTTTRDNLQIFRLTASADSQKIVHTQEQPPYEQELDLPAEDAVTQKVYMIDDGSYVTMLLAEEY